MKRVWNVFVLGSGVLAFCLLAGAQTRPQDPYYPPRDYPSYGNRDGSGPDRYSQPRGYGYGRGQDSLVGRVLSDLNRAAARAYVDGHERRHFDEAAGALQDFQARLARGRFDTGKLDKAIDHLRHLAEADRVHGRDRDMLARDVQDLRQFRATRGRYDRYPESYPNWR